MHLNMLHTVTLAPAYKAHLGTGEIPKILHFGHDIVLKSFCLLSYARCHLLTNNLLGSPAEHAVVCTPFKKADSP